MYTVVISGADGKMGKIAIQAINQAKELECIGQITRNDNFKTELLQRKPDILIDFTTPEMVYQHTLTTIDLGIRPVIGTSGLTIEQVEKLKEHANRLGVSGVIAPNFCQSAILMMQFSALAAKHYDSANIIEQHHPNKIDAPSGTAIKTADMIKGNIKDVAIKSIRRPGVIAKQSVIFSNQHETLTIEQDSIGRESFIPGIIFACKHVMQTNSFTYGLENIL
jgi:4-hydroxy-tetrahydrodipicolinate reductase